VPLAPKHPQLPQPPPQRQPQSPPSVPQKTLAQLQLSYSPQHKNVAVTNTGTSHPTIAAPKPATARDLCPMGNMCHKKKKTKQAHKKKKNKKTAIDAAMNKKHNLFRTHVLHYLMPLQQALARWLQARLSEMISIFPNTFMGWLAKMSITVIFQAYMTYLPLLTQQ